MPDVNVSADMLGTLNSEADGEIIAFYWCTEYDIQKYLDEESVIKIDDGYDLTDAIRMENDVVIEIVGYLNSVYVITKESNSRELRVVAAKLTAAAIGQARQGSSMGNSLVEWTSRLQNSAWSTLQRYFINQNLIGLTKITVPFVTRLFTSKLRERAVVPSV